LKRGNRKEDAALVVRLIENEVGAWDDFVNGYSSAIFGAVAIHKPLSQAAQLPFS